MGVESCFYVLPENSSYRPEVSTVFALMAALQQSQFVFEPHFEGFTWRPNDGKGRSSLSELEASLSQQPAADLVLRWRIDDLAASGLKYPLTEVPGDDAYYTVAIHLSAETVYHTSDVVEPFDLVRCRCGNEIEEMEAPHNDAFFASRLPNRCPSCDEVVNYAELPMKFSSGWIGESQASSGGVTYRCCLVIDSGKMFPGEGATVTPEFLALAEGVLGVKVRVVRDFY